MRKLKLAIQAEQNLNGELTIESVVCGKEILYFTMSSKTFLFHLDPDSRLSLQIASNASDHGEEDMEVEYMESEVLFDVSVNSL